MITVAEIAIGLIVATVAMEVTIGTWMCWRISRDQQKEPWN